MAVSKEMVPEDAKKMASLPSRVLWRFGSDCEEGHQQGAGHYPAEGFGFVAWLLQRSILPRGEDLRDVTRAFYGKAARI